MTVLPADAPPGALLCPRCGHALPDEQAWCLECGLAARTRIHPSPSPRTPVVLTFLVLALLAAGLAFALVTLLDTTEPKPAATTVTVLSTSTAPPAATAPATTFPTAPSGATTTPAPTFPTTTPATPGRGTPAPTGTTPRRAFTVPGTHITIPSPASSR